MAALKENPLLLAVTAALIGAVTGYLVGVQKSSDRTAIIVQNPPPIPSNPAPPRRPGPAFESARIPRFATTNPPGLESPRRAAPEEMGQSTLSNIVARTAAEADAAYDHVFSALEVDAATASRIKADLVKLHHLAIAAGEPMTELVIARDKFDQFVRSALGEEKYQLYRNFEESKPAAKEYEQIERFALARDGTVLDPGYADQVIQMIKKAGAATFGTWHGPYDPLPRPLVGMDKMREQFRDFESSAQNVLKDVESRGLPEELVHVISAYYESKLREREQEIRYFERPWSERREEMVNEQKKQMENLIRNSRGSR